MNDARLQQLRAEVRAWEHEQFGSLPAERSGAVRDFRAPPGNWPRLQIPIWDEAMEIRAAVSPDCSFRLLRDALLAAKKSVDVYIYNLQSDRIAELLRALPAGVKLRIMFDVTDHNATSKEQAELATIKQSEQKAAPSAGNRRIFTVCHQKYVVIDNTAVVLGSANWAESSIPYVLKPGTFKKGNREWLLHLKSAAVAEWFTNLFEADWEIPATRGAPAALELARPGSVMVPARAIDPPKPVDVLISPKGANVQITPVISPQNYFEDVGQLIRSAKKSIYIQQQYILVGGAKVEALIQDVAHQASELDVRIMVSPTFPQNWERSVKTLSLFGLQGKLKALNLDHYVHLHNKGLIIDGKHVVVSSTNWSQNSIDSAREAGVIITSKQAAAFFGKAFKTDWDRGWDPSEVNTRTRQLFRDTPDLEPGAFVEVPSSELVS
jgi:phosphatidylserine/phosphatidylglycerophosphate/cardiolipin synthase-like enzyme